jgi:hypothetical protein
MQVAFDFQHAVCNLFMMTCEINQSEHRSVVSGERISDVIGPYYDFWRTRTQENLYIEHKKRVIVKSKSFLVRRYCGPLQVKKKKLIKKLLNIYQRHLGKFENKSK